MEHKKSRYSELLDQSREKREQHRQRVLKTGAVFFNNGYSSFACKIKNQTENGVMLEFENTLGIPDEFKFRMSGQGSSAPAKMIWRTEKRMGIVLLSQ